MKISDYKTILTVSELTREVKLSLESGFREVWVEGEISNLRSPSSGHCYFTLKDDSSQIRAVIFRFMGRYLTFQPEDGLQVICRGKVSVYEPRGEYQLILDYLEPKGIGALQLAFEQLKERLKKEGLFDHGHKKELPFLPSAIGVVTSPSGAAVRDLIKVITRRFPAVTIIINPVRVQGDGAAEEIARAIVALNRLPGIEVIIVTRGGGSLEDLWPFNDEGVARAIFSSTVPVISAVGHEIDYTIADFVADLRAPTPSAAGELVVPDRMEIINHMESLSARIKTRMKHLLELEQRSCRALAGRLPDLRFRLSELQSKVDDCRTRLAPRLLQLVRLRKESLTGAVVRLSLRNPKHLIRDCSKTLALYQKGLSDGAFLLIRNYWQRVAGTTGALDSLSPLRVLQRGYSITRGVPSGEIVKESAALSPGDTINTVLGKGEVDSAVIKVYH